MTIDLRFVHSCEGRNPFSNIIVLLMRFLDKACLERSRKAQNDNRFNNVSVPELATSLIMVRLLY